MKTAVPSFGFLPRRSARRSHVFLALLLLWLAGVAAVLLWPQPSAALTLSAPQSLGIPGIPINGSGRYVAVGDLNNDGIPDVVSLDYSAPYVHVALGQGNRTFLPGPEVQNTVPSGGVALADVNYDGKLDLIITDYYGGGIRIYLGNGDGSFGVPVYYADSPTTKYAQDIVVADFNGDGNLDIAIQSVYNSHAVIFYLNHSGVVTSTINIGGSGFGVIAHLDVGDYDGDGAPDLFLATFNSTVPQVLWKLRDPGGASQRGFGIGGIGSSIRSLRAGDLLGNSKAAMVLTDNANVFVVPQPLVSADAILLASHEATDAIIADVDGDGIRDVLATSTDPNNSDPFSYGRVEFYRHTGNANFAPPQYFLTGSGDAADIVVADLDGDGNPDIVLASQRGRRDALVMWNNTPRAPTITSGNSASFVAGVSNAFTCKAKGYPAPTFATSSTLPAGVTLSPDGVLSGTPAQSAAGVYSLLITASNGVSPAVTQSFTLTVTGTVPTMGAPFFNTVTNSSARLGGNVTSDNGYPITRRGIVYAPTSVNPNPTLGGTGVLSVDDGLATTGVFTQTVAGLSASTGYSFAAFAVNSRGTTYSSVATFQTLAPPGSGSLVVTTATDEDDGNSDPNVGTGTSLREAVAYANALGGDRTITFSPNLFANGPATITLTRGPIALANLSGTTTVAGPGAGQLKIQGNGSAQLFVMDQGSATLNALTLSGGRTISNGGAIRSYGTLVVNDCAFTQNTAPNGSGGAIYNGGSGVFSRCTFDSNSAGSTGGAIGDEGSLWAMDCTFYGNSAATGGAIRTVFSSSVARVICSTLTGNSATSGGGGISYSNGASSLLYNTIVSGNTAPTDPNLSGTPNSSGLASDLIDADPTAIFTTGTLADNGSPTQTIALKPGGPAVNAGNNSLAIDNTFTLLSTDGRGKPRVIGSTVDIGAYEAPVLPTLGASTVTNITATSATLGGNVTSDGFGIITKRGVVYAPTSQNPNPTVGGVGVTEVDASGTTGAFSVPIGGLTALTGYAFTSFVTNEIGTVYAPVQTFATTETRSLTVTTLSDTANGSDGQTSLREALAYAQSLGGARTIAFDPSLGGQTITLSAGWNGANDDAALRISGQITLQGPTTSPGVTVAMAQGVQKRHITIEATGNLAVSNLTFTGGSGDYGGSIRSFGTLAIHGCTFTANSASQDGGAVHGATGSASLLIENCTLSGNSCTGASASAIASGALQNTYRYLTITANSGGSGTIDIYQYPATLVNSIVAGNSPDGIIQLVGGVFSAGSTNNILGSGGSGGLTNGANGNLTSVSISQFNLGSLANSGGPTPTIALLPGSLAIDAGTSVSGSFYDQRGTARPQGVASDIGAFELVQTQEAAAPIFTPQAGTYASGVQVAITSPSANALIRYTLDGSDPTETNGQLYTGGFTLTGPATVKALAFGRGWLDSSITSVTYSVLAPLPYWRNLQGLATNGGQDLANPSGDGVANLLKYAFNLAPQAGDLNKPNYAILPPNGTAGLPLITRDAQGRLVIEFVRRKAETNPGVSYLVETTGGPLTGWSTLDLSGAAVISIDSTWERVTVTDPAVTPNRFGRVRVQ